MGRDLTTSSASHQDPEKTRLQRASWHLSDATLPGAAKLLAAMALGALLLALVYQIPVTHTVDIGGYDSAYVQGFFEPERDAGPQRPELIGSDGSARWTNAASYILFPQAGLPAQLTLRLRGWRLNGAAANVEVLLNGTIVLDRFRAGADWEDHTFQINGGLLKPNDVVIEIRSETSQIRADDPREVGVLIDRATFHSGPAPIIPYPPQLLYGALAAGMLWLLTRHDQGRTTNDKGQVSRRRSSFVLGRSSVWLIGIVLLALSFLLLYRAQPLYPYPLLRLLPAIDGVLAALLVIRIGPALVRRVPILLDMLAVGGIGAWTAAVLVGAQQHVTLSLPSVEGDFRVFALRSAHLIGQFPAGTNTPDRDGVLRADGFYNLGYPLLLWLMRPFTGDNPFLAGRLIAALSGAVLLLACWWLTRRLLGRSGALLALLILALSPLVVEYALYLGTDMPFAAACTLALALLVRIVDCRPVLPFDTAQGSSTVGGLQIADYEHQATDDSTLNRVLFNSQTPRGHPLLNFRFNSQVWLLLLAGIAAGAAFLIRHPGLLLLPFGWFVIWQRFRLKSSELPPENPKSAALGRIQHPEFLLLFTVAFLITISPQLYVNLRDTSSPFFNQQAKNVWQAVFSDGDWDRWAATGNDISLSRVIAQDPTRFLANWWANVRGFVGTGGEDTREFGQATQLRLLSFPTNWLAIVGLLGWMMLGFRQLRQADKQTSTQATGDRTSAENHFLIASPLGRFLVALLAWIALYVATISIGLAPQARFFLPLVPIYALAAAWTIIRMQPNALLENTTPIPQYAARLMRSIARNAALIVGIVLLVLLWGGFASGAAYVTRVRATFDNNAPGQPADEVAAARLVLQTLHGDQRLVLEPPQGSIDGLSLGKYSAIADRVVPTPARDDLAALRATGADYLLRATTLGPAPGGLPAVGSAGGYTLYTIPR
ncbi:MAG: glycosyltransferase family 39 protein [Roseiflexaceae bacterium]